MSDRPSFAPYLVVSNAAAAIDFYKDAFGAEELARHQAPGTDKIMHAHLIINGGHIMMSDDFSAMHGGKSETPEALGGSPVTFNLQVSDANAAWDKALSAGARVAMPLADQFWGDRYGQLTDPFGHKWSICQSIRTPSAEELEEAAKAAMPA
jgi:PhnB protein